MRNAVLALIVLLCLACSSSAITPTQAQEPATALRGRVVDAGTGEPVAKAKIIVGDSELSRTTDDSGAFAFDALPAGDVELTISTVGYALVKRTITLRVNETNEIEIALSQEAATIVERVNVAAAPYDPVASNAPAIEQTLDKRELADLSSVVVRDPVRAAQALPAVVANDDFRSEFSVRGAGFDRTGVFLDEVLTDNFVYTVQNALDTGSLSIINADTIETLSLYPGAQPAEYGDSSAGVLAFTTREGNRVKPAVRVGLSIVNVNGVVDGPFANKRGGFLFSARRSFAGYVTRRLQSEVEDTNNPPVVEVADLQGRIVYDFNPRHRVGLSAIYGDFDLDVNRPREEVGLNSIFRAGSRNSLVNFAYAYTPDDRIALRARVFGIRRRLTNRNPNDVLIDETTRTQFGARGDASYRLRSGHQIEAGTYLRSLGARQSNVEFLFPTLETLQTSFFDRDAFEQAYYVQDTYTNERLRLAASGGVRVEHSGRSGETVFSPRASFSLGFGEDYRLRAGFGRHHQFPDFSELYGSLGNTALETETSTHYNVSFERFIGTRTRIVAEVYDREDRDLPFSLSEPRLDDGQVIFPRSALRNTLDGYARGVELSVQRRSANGLTGFASYAYSRTSLRDWATGFEFPSDFDQRHTLSLYGNYRFTETVSFSAQWRLGSGQPIPGFLRRDAADDLFLAAERNRVRLPIYSRVDVRASKLFLFDRFKLTLTGEVLNLLDRDNLRYTGFDGYGSRSGRVFGSLTRTLPILPSAGVVVEF